MFVGEGQDWAGGEERAWELLSEFNFRDVCRRARVAYDEAAGHYLLSLFNERVMVAPREREMQGDSPLARYLLNNLRHYSRLSILWYLVQSQDVPLSGNLIGPGNVPGGQMFFEGTHRLPLDRLAQKYDRDVPGFLRQGMKFGGEQLDYGDAALRQFPFPRIPVVLVLWASDDEFPERADILFDSTCSIHLPTDMIGSTVMMSI